MAFVYLATIGQRPQAVTVAFDQLKETYSYERIGLLHTDPLRSGIANQLRELSTELNQAYPELAVDKHEVKDLNGYALLDIEDDVSAEAYFYGIVDALLYYKQQGYKVHLMVAGGRKAMSIYAVYAASLLLDEFDAVWTVLTPPKIIERKVYHVNPAERKDIRLTHLPFLPSRFAPTTLETLTRKDIIEHLDQRKHRKELLLSKLTPAQRRVVNAIALHDDFTDEQIADLLVLSVKTVQRHLQDIYSIMRTVFDYGDKIRDTRLALRKIMKGWE